MSRGPRIRGTAYRIENSSRAWLEEIDNYSRSIDRYGATAEYRTRLVPLVLVEAIISDVDDRFDAADFTQEMEQAPKGTWQVAYDESLLSADGCSLFLRGAGCATGVASARVCFYFHFYDPTKPMKWTYGEFHCSPVEPIAMRLANLVPYRDI